jgi:hypothetical protein
MRLRNGKDMASDKIQLSVSQDDSGVAYVTLPGHPGRGSPGVTKSQIRLRDIYPDYIGPDLYFDLSEDRTLIGIEILV